MQPESLFVHGLGSSFLATGYLIFYRVLENEERIEILRYWHAARGNLQLPE
jgi:plasmid stabilization system protein ParE